MLSKQRACLPRKPRANLPAHSGLAAVTAAVAPITPLNRAVSSLLNCVYDSFYALQCPKTSTLGPYSRCVSEENFPALRQQNVIALGTSLQNPKPEFDSWLLALPKLQ